METFDPKKLGALLAGLALALLGITKSDIFSPEVDQFLSQPITAKLSLLAGLLITYAAIVLFIGDVYASRARAAASQREEGLREQIKKSNDEHEEREKDLREQIKKSNDDHEEQIRKSNDDYRLKLYEKKQEIDALLRQVQDRDRLRLLDIVTGIPNQLKWEKDVQNLSKSDDPDPHYQMVMIDLDNFREINKVYGYEKGDQVIKEFARTVFNSMRRDEHIYKYLVFEENMDDLKKGSTNKEGIYRKYPGGDEFILLVNGDQLEALGLLNRLARELMPKINDRVSKFILNSETNISFHAGMCEWILGDEPIDVLHRLEQTMSKATNNPDSRLYYHPEITPDEFEHRVLQSTGKPPRWNPYRDAARIFAKVQNNN